MDSATLNQYREIVRRIIEEYASHKPSHGQIDTEAVIDPSRDHYEVMQVGWDGDRRVHGTALHLDILNGKIWIQFDGTAPGVALDLLDAGIPREAIVLGFHPPYVRAQTGFAVE